MNSHQFQIIKGNNLDNFYVLTRHCLVFRLLSIEKKSKILLKKKRRKEGDRLDSTKNRCSCLHPELHMGNRYTECVFSKKLRIGTNLPNDIWYKAIILY